MMSINEMGFEVFEEMLDLAEDLRVDVIELENGAVVIDAGVKAPGGLWAGIFISRICMADMADIQIVPYDLKGISVPGIQVTTDHPAVSCMGSQCAMWQIKVDKYFAMGSGPARALARKTKELYERIGLDEYSDVGAIVLESSRIPDAAVAARIAEMCGIEPSDLRIAVAPTDSVAGMVQVSARIVETGMHKLFSMGFDITKIKSGWGVAPIAPVAGDATRCMGASNDAIIYGGDTYYTLEYENLDELKDYVRKMPSYASRDYGVPFYNAFKAAGFDFFKVDHNIFAPARVVMNELKSRTTIVSGKLNHDVLMESFGIQML
ncbi:methenyltetrahydromethanopterin cyclohydrolase [Methanothrix sp.]|uniref:methenyltetrahydromethanopterin cyclohydrolase n=1 Tax=Methanothrix sp. TaxID=90426 RepID=UPI0034E28F68